MGFIVQALVKRAARGEATLALWNAMRALSEPATVNEIHQATQLRPDTVHVRLKRWVSVGFVQAIGFKPTRFIMNSDAPASPPEVGETGVRPRRTVRERIWTAMRVCKSFDVPTLEMAAQAKRETVKSYVYALQRSGHLRCTVRGNSMTEWSIYVLARNTGPKAPRITVGTFDDERRRAVLDPNTNSLTDIAPPPAKRRPGRRERGVNHVR